MGGNQDDPKKDPRELQTQIGKIRKRSRSLDLGGVEESSQKPPSHDECSNVDTHPTSGHEIVDRSSETFVTSQAAVASTKSDEQEDYSSDVEILLVIQPPTPKRPKTRGDQNLPPSELRKNAEPRATTIVTPSAQGVVNPMTTTDRPKYSYRSSAYVQNLAEICHTILWDRRWRVGDNATRIFSWERGENLSAVHSLSRLYLEERPKSEKKRESATCLLCRCSMGEKKTLDKEDNGHEHENTAEQVDQSVDNESEVNNTTTNETCSRSDDHESLISTEEDEARALHLYCRLFYRKGPWFRLDDLYTRYYAPKREGNRSESASANSDTAITENNSNDLRRGEQTEIVSQADCHKKTTFFLPIKQAAPNNGQRKAPVVDESAVHECLGALSQLCHDVFRLHSMGLIRSFLHEEECGKTVGAEGTGVILTAEERRFVLSKLGGASKTKRYPSFSAADKVDESRHQSRENHVWRQMCRQQSIVGQIQGSAESKSLLPVCRHVNTLLLEKLATKVVLSASPGTTFPASVLRERVSEICRILRDISVDGGCATVADFNMCIRLSEPPLRTLRRFTRLYLCASNGPGNMRGDGTNGWMSLRDSSDTGVSHSNLPLLNYVQPPGSHAWHNIAYPALLHRFGVRTCAFTGAYQSLVVAKDSDECHRGAVKGNGGLNHSIKRGQRAARMERVFSSVGDFHNWELCAEIRANIDYLVEVNDLMHYHERRKAKERDTKDSEEGGMVEEDSPKSSSSNLQPTKEPHPPPFKSVPVDFLEVLTTSGRSRIVQKLLHPNESNDSLVQKKVEDEILSLCNTGSAVTVASVSTEVSSDNSGEQETENSLQAPGWSSATIGRFENDFETLIAVISIVAVNVLIARQSSVSPEEVSLMAARPWLRHMWWDGNLAYVLWDCVPLLERRGYYDLASKALEVLLFGSPQEHPWKTSAIGTSTYASSCGYRGSLCPPPSTLLSSLLISRRARGKAYERLTIDYTHMLRIRARAIADAERSDVALDQTSSTKRGRKKSNSLKDTQLPVKPRDTVAHLCNEALTTLATTGSIPFSAVRSLARRVRRPLVELLSGRRCMESTELGLRLENAKDDCAADNATAKKSASGGYQDWTPVTDHAVANAIEGESTTVGKRCSFVGFEDSGVQAIAPSSLNVEELAMEFYASGRLPSVGQTDAKYPRGGWVGWHDEGGYVRALFRIICSNLFLDMDGGCGNHCGNTIEAVEAPTIFLTRYQSAPFDLHVGHAATATGQVPTGKVQKHGGDNIFVRGFYERRRDRVDRFLSKLETLEKQELCNLVFDSVVERFRVLGSKGERDTSLQRDLRQIRTLSMLAAGFGGRMLSAVFRMFAYDYRHYSSGLPDLLLVRATHDEKASDDKTGFAERLLDLGEWVGEGFSAESRQEKEMARRVSLLVDRDDEFLGCSKMGDSAGQSGGRWRGGGQQRSLSRKEGARQDSGVYTIQNLPQKLCLVHNELHVNVECMFVEVKSSNDRLDPRQEDWLNVLDRFGNARVCKFGDGKRKRGKRP